MATLYFAGEAVNFGNSTVDSTISVNTNWTGTATYSYRNLIVAANATLSIGREAVVKISGTLTVFGTITNYDWNGGNAGGSQTGWTDTRGAGGGGGGGATGGQSGGAAGYAGSAGGAAYGDNSGGITSQYSVIPLQYNGGAGGMGGGDGGGPSGGSGAGSFKIMARFISIADTGKITANGQKGSNGSGGSISGYNAWATGGGGGGGGGTIVIFSENVSGLGSISANGGLGGDGGYGSGGGVDKSGGYGGAGGSGRILFAVGTSSIATSPTKANLSGGTITYDATGPTINTPTLSFPNGAGSNQNQIVTTFITDTQTAVSNPTAVFQTVTGINSGTATLKSFTSDGTATFTVSNQTGSGTARIVITAVDAAGNSSTANSPAWTIDNSSPSGYVPYFGYGTDNWILDGRTISGLTYFSGTQIYAVTNANDPTLDYYYSLASLTIPAGFSLIWCGVLYLSVNGTSTINGTLGWTSTAMGDGTTMRNGGGTGGLGGRSSSYSSYYPNRDVGFWGGTEGQDNPSGYGWNSSGLWSYGPSAGDVTSVSWPETPTAYGGNPGWRLWKNPNSADTISTVLARGVAVGGGGSGGACCGNDQRGGNGAWGGPGLVFKTQTLNGSGVITVSARGGEQKGGSVTKGEASGGAGGGGHSVIITGTSNFTGSLSADYGYNTFWRNAGSTPSATPAITNTTIVDTTIPATSADNQPSVTSALLTSVYRKKGQVQRVSISYNKTMTDSEVKITLSGEATLAATVMTKASSPANTYYYDYTHGAGNGTITYSIAAKDNVLNPASTVSGSWILDNTAPSFTSSISPNKTFFLGGESISYTITGTEANSMASVPSFSLVRGSDFDGRPIGGLNSVGSYTTGSSPYDVACDPTGKFVYVTNYGASSGTNGVSAYTINAGGVLGFVGSYTTGAYPCSVACDPTGKFVYVIDADGVSAYTINAGGVLGFVGSYTVRLWPYSVACDPTGKFVYVTNGTGSGATYVSAYTITAGTGVLGFVGSYATGLSPWGVACDPTGKFVYVTNSGASGGTNGVSAYTITAGTGALGFVGSYTTGSSPYNVACDPTGKFVYVANTYNGAGGNTVSAYTINTTSTLPAIVLPLTTSSVSGSTYTYSSTTTLPIGIGTLSATVSGTDSSANTGTNSGLSTIKLLPPSGMLWS